MKPLILALTAIAIFCLADQAAAKADETLTIDVGKSRTADRGRIKIEFLSVVEDSRCPRDATCVWAGNARIRINVFKGRKSKIVELNTTLEPRVVNVFGYNIQLSDLHPRSGDDSPQKAASAVITLKRN